MSESESTASRRRRRRRQCRLDPGWVRYTRRQDTTPRAPRILEGPFRNVDPHTASLAVYFRGPASELFNMLNPESPGAISVLSHVATRASVWMRGRRDVCVMCVYVCDKMLTCVRARM